MGTLSRDKPAEYMRAWTYTSPGLPSKILSFTDTHPLPQMLGTDEVLIKISHCGFNAGVILITQFLPSWLHKTPAIPELDLSGTIVASKAPSRTDLQVGTKVFGCCPPALHFRYGAGTLAEYIVMPASTVSAIPSNATLESAAGLGGCGCTAVQIVRRANIKKGNSVFINGGSGGLGSILVQVVKAAVGESGQVVATCSARNAKFVKELGADEVIDYAAHASLTDHVKETYSNKRFDAIIDTVGIQELYLSSPAYLKEQGLFLNGGGMLVTPTWRNFLAFFAMMAGNYLYPSFLPGGVPRNYAFLSGSANPADLKSVVKLVEDGSLTVPIDSVWKMEDAKNGYEVIESKRARGKVVVRVQDD